MKNYTNNMVMTKSINAFCLNFGEWFFEGQLVTIKDSKLGLLSNVLITFVNDTNGTVTVKDQNDKNIRLELSKIASIECVERRRNIVANF